MNMVVIGAVVACVAGAGLVLAMNGPLSATGEPMEKPTQQVKDPSLLNGVWRSRGYGWLAEIRDGDISLYDENDSFCTPWSSDLDIDPLSARIEISNDGLKIKLPVTDEAFLQTFDRIAALPEVCSTDPDATPQAVLDTVIDLFSNHYAFFEHRNVKWPELAAASRLQLEEDASEDELLNVLGNMFAEIDDAHVSLEGESNGIEVLREAGDGKTLTRVAAQGMRSGLSADQMIDLWEDKYWEQDVAETLLRGKGVRAANDQVAYGLIDGRIGYIAIRSMEGFDDDADNIEDEIAAVERAMEPAMKLFRNARAVIVDISINDGGYDQVARAVASRFAAERAVAYYKHAGDADADRPQAIHITPNPGTRYTGPVYLVTSDVSVSAAEIFTMSMRALPNVKHVGDATRGALSDTLLKTLPNGWSLSLSNEVYLDAEGELWEGKGIPPQVPMTIFSEADVNKGHVEAIRKIAQMIR